MSAARWFVSMFLLIPLSTTLLIAQPTQEPVLQRDATFVPIPRLPEVAVQERLDAMLYDWQALELELAEMARVVSDTGRLTLYLEGRAFDLVLQPNDLRAEGYRQVWMTAQGPVERTPRSLGTFKGHVVGSPESSVRVTVKDGFFHGYIYTGEQWLFIDPLTKYDPLSDPAAVVVYRDEDVRPTAVGTCGSGGLRNAFEVIFAGSSRGLESLAAGSTTLREVDVATEADFEYYDTFGGNTNSHIASVVNGVDGIYESQLSLSLRIVFQSVWTTSGDPYSATTIAATLVNEFQNYWNTNRSDVNRDLAHLFTGKTLANTVIGRASDFGTVCRVPTQAYSISQNFALETKLVAHEFGHLFDAIHDNIAPAAATCGTGQNDRFGPIMCTPIQTNGPDTFSGRSSNDIRDHVANHGQCLRTLSSTPVASFTWTDQGGTRIFFNASASHDPDGGSIQSYKWVFGDGSSKTTTSPTTTHVYPWEGAFAVELTVTDDEGQKRSTSRGITTCAPEIFCTVL